MHFGKAEHQPTLKDCGAQKLGKAMYAYHTTNMVNSIFAYAV